MKNVKIVLAVLVILAVFGIVGNMDFKDEVRSQLHYCDCVDKGIWPDFKGIYAKECTPEKIKRLNEYLR